MGTLWDGKLGGNFLVISSIVLATVYYCVVAFTLHECGHGHTVGGKTGIDLVKDQFVSRL